MSLLEVLIKAKTTIIQSSVKHHLSGNEVPSVELGLHHFSEKLCGLWAGQMRFLLLSISGIHSHKSTRACSISTL